MTDLQKQIEELELAANQKACNSDTFSTKTFIRLEKHMARRALSIIKQLQEELEKQREDYEALSKDFVALEEEINQLKGENNDR